MKDCHLDWAITQNGISDLFLIKMCRVTCVTRSEIRWHKSHYALTPGRPFYVKKVKKIKINFFEGHCIAFLIYFVCNFTEMVISINKIHHFVSFTCPYLHGANYFKACFLRCLMSYVIFSTTEGAMELYHIPIESLQYGLPSHIYNLFPIFMQLISPFS